MNELRWHIGKERAPLDRPPYRPYFYWVENHRLVDSADYDAPQLTANIEQRRKSGGDISPFQAALKELAKANGG